MLDAPHVNNPIKPSVFDNIKHTSNWWLVVLVFIVLVKAGYDISQGAVLFGDKNIAFFDAWSFEHIITGMSMSYFFYLFSGPYTAAMKADDAKEIANLEMTEYSPSQLEGIRALLERKTHRNKIIHHSLVVLCIAFAWEIIELYMETAVFATTGIEYYFWVAQEWFSGVELFLNRFVVDVVLVYLGWYVVRHRPAISQIAAPVSLAWLMIHIWVFQDSMFLHEQNFSTIMNSLFSLSTIYVLLGVAVFSYGMWKLKFRMEQGSTPQLVDEPSQ